MLGQKRHYLPADLQIRHIGVQLDPVQAFDVQRHPPVEHVSDGDDPLGHDDHLDTQRSPSTGTAELDDLFATAIQELDPTKEEQLGNQIDAMLWELALNIPLFQRPDIVATKSTLANYGAFGYANLIFEDIGFTR